MDYKGIGSIQLLLEQHLSIRRGIGERDKGRRGEC